MVWTPAATLLVCAAAAWLIERAPGRAPSGTDVAFGLVWFVLFLLVIDKPATRP